MDGFNMNNFFPEPKKVDRDIKRMILDNRDYRNADYQYELLLESIANFEKELNDDQEVAIQLASFGQSIVMQVTDIGYANPSLIHFYGYVNGTYSHLIQHVSQLSFLLTVSPKLEADKPPIRIGFVQSEVD